MLLNVKLPSFNILICSFRNHLRSYVVIVTTQIDPCMPNPVYDHVDKSSLAKLGSKAIHKRNHVQVQRAVSGVM